MSVHQARDYLSGLDGRLAAGLARLPERFRATQVRHAESAQRPDGGFGGRQGGSDLYYTDFALRTLAVLGASQSSEAWRRAADYLRARGPHAEDAVECFCLLNAARLIEARGQSVWPDRAAARRGIAEALDRQRTPHGGYAKGLCGCTSIYHTFLGTLCETLLGQDHPHAADAVGFVWSRACPDGGFADLACIDGRSGLDGGTNQTAAAIALLALLDALDQATASRAAGFLVAMQRPDGGFAAHAAAPAADLMSTFTALVALGDLEALSRVRRADVARFVKSLARPDGGFRSMTADQDTDLEYTYYGLGALALLSLEAQRGRA